MRIAVVVVDDAAAAAADTSEAPEAFERHLREVSRRRLMERGRGERAGRLLNEAS